jgi:signal transduction histidine kinase
VNEMNLTFSQSRFSLPVRLVIGILIILALSLFAFYILMNPPMTDMGLMAVFLTITAVISALAAYGAYRLGWLNLSPTIRLTLMGIYLLSGVLTFINIWMTAKLMFASLHDLLLATILLLYASGIAIVIGYFFTTALTDRINQVENAAHSITGGELETRIPVTGQDEIAQLAVTFNSMAAQLQAAADQRRQVEQLRRDLIAWVSHDLQTPLASIRAVVEALADGVVDDPGTSQRYLRTAQRDIAALSILIDDLFQMAQLDAGGLKLDLADNSLSDLISDTLESFSETAKANGISLQGSVSPQVDPVWMDAQRIGRVLNNLVGNALRYTPYGGQVRVKGSLLDDKVLVEIRDTGEGIPEQDLPLVFDRFYRGEKSRSRTTGGAGLGLAIARGIVEAHHGQINVESQPGKGTRFFFTLHKSES